VFWSCNEYNRGIDQVVISAVIAVAGGYLLGSIPFAYIAGRLKKGIDIRQVGSGNMGAANVMRHVGTAVGYAVFAADIAKGLLAVFIARWLDLSLVWVLIAGFAAVVGHNWPVFLGFKGGRGGATTMGVFLALVPLEFALSFAITFVVVVITSNPGLGLGLGLVFLPLIIWQINGSGILITYALLLSIFLGIRCLLAEHKIVASGVSLKSRLFPGKEYHFWQTKKR